MPLDYQQQVYKVTSFQGMDNFIRDTLNKTERGDVASFCRFDSELGSLTKAIVLGYATSSTEAGTAGVKIDSFYRHYNTIASSPAGQWYAFCDGDYKTFTTSWQTDLSTAPTAGERGRFISYDANLYSFTKSSDPLKIVTYTAGTGARATVAVEMGAPYIYEGAAGNVDIGAHKYLVTFGGAGETPSSEIITGAISNSITIASSTKKIEVVGIPKGPVGTTQRRLYRTKVGDQTDYFECENWTGTDDNVETTYSDNTADASLGAAHHDTDSYTVTDDIPTGEFPLLHKERLFLAGNTTYKNRLYYSTTYSMDYIQSATATVTYEDIAPDDSDEIMQIADFLNSVTILKKNSIRRLYTEGSASQWSLSAVLSPVGTTASDSVAIAPIGIIYLGFDGFYLFNGNFSKKIIIQFDYHNILKTRLNQCVGYYHNNKYHFAYPDASVGESENNRYMQYDIVKDTMTIEPRNISWFHAAAGEGDSGDLHYADSQKGYIHGPLKSTQSLSYGSQSDLDTGTNFDANHIMGTEINPKIQTSWDPGTEDYEDIDSDNYEDLTTETYLTKDHVQGIYESAPAQISAGTLGSLYWNEETDATYSQDVQFFVRTGATESAVADSTSCTAEADDEKFTAVSHGLGNGDRVRIGGTTVPAGIDEGIMYYVISVVGNDFQVSLTLGGSAVTYTTDGTSVTFKKWADVDTEGSEGLTYTDPTGSDISGVTAAAWIQWAVNFKSSTAGYTPYVHRPSGGDYAAKLTYNEVATASESGLLMRWRSGWRNFEVPEVDKIFQKVILVYYTDTTESGKEITFDWEARGQSDASGTMTINLDTNPKRYETFLPLDAYGKEFRFELQNSDIDSDELTFKEISIVWAPLPLII